MNTLLRNALAVVVVAGGGLLAAPAGAVPVAPVPVPAAIEASPVGYVVTHGYRPRRHCVIQYRTVRTYHGYVTKPVKVCSYH